MQVLKEEVRKKIRSASIKAFKEYGYRKASMREIAIASDMSVGNLYRYYESKEALFGHLVQPLIDQFFKDKEYGGKCEHKANFLNVNFLEHSEIIELFIGCRSIYREELFILFLRSEGSPFEGFKAKLKEFLGNKMRKYLKTEFSDEEIIKGSVFIKATVSAMTESFCVVLENTKDNKEFIYNILEISELIYKPAIRNLLNVRDNKTDFRRISDEEIYRHLSNISNNISDSST